MHRLPSGSGPLKAIIFVGSRACLYQPAKPPIDYAEDFDHRRRETDPPRVA